MGKSLSDSEKLKVLIIEDDLRYRSIVSQSLPDCEKIFANDPETGWAFFLQHAPDIVFLDLTFAGGITGLNVLKQIKEFDPKSYVVVITASQLSSDFNSAMQLGASGYITKPFSTKSLSDYVKKYNSLNPGNTVGINRRKLYESRIEKQKAHDVEKTIEEHDDMKRFDDNTDKKFSLSLENSLVSKLYDIPAAEEALIDKRIYLPDLVAKWRVLVAGPDDISVKNITTLLEKTFFIQPDVATNSEDALKMLLKGKYNMAFISLKFHPKSGYYIVNEYITADSRNPNSTYLIGLKGDSLLDDTEKWQQAGLNAIINFDETNWIEEIKRLVVYYTREKAIFLSEHLKWADSNTDHDALLEMEKQYQALSQSLTHVFSDPLRAILQTTMTLEESEKRETALKKLAEMKRWTTLSLKRLQGLSEYDQISIHQPLTDISLNKVIQAALKDLLPLMKKRGARIKTFGVFPDVVCHPAYLKKAIYHIIKNGIEHNQSMPPIVALSCQEQDGDLILKIQDNGIGIEKIYTDYIFSLFECLDAGTDNPGLGLPTAKKIMEQHAGKIWFESASQGTVFFLSLPKHGHDKKGDLAPKTENRDSRKTG